MSPAPEYNDTAGESVLIGDEEEPAALTHQ
jgi:hypothetical protein